MMWCLIANGNITCRFWKRILAFKLNTARNCVYIAIFNRITTIHAVTFFLAFIYSFWIKWHFHCTLCALLLRPEFVLLFVNAWSLLHHWPDNTTSNPRTDWTSSKVFKLMNNDGPVQDTVCMSIVHVGHLIFNCNISPSIYVG